MKKKMAKLLVFALALTVAVTCFPAETSAASKRVKMTVYDQVLKSGNTVYCAGAEGIYKVTVTEAGEVTGSKLLFSDETYGNYSYFSGMKKKGGYLYCQSAGEGTWFGLCRISTSTGKFKDLASLNDVGPVSYVIKGKKIYYKGHDSKKKRVMKLNGKSKKKTSVTPVMNNQPSNAAGYSITYTEQYYGQDESEVCIVTTYLNTPKGKYKLGSHEA